MPNTSISTTPGGNRGGTHILMFPFPAQGHMLPLLDLVHQIALRATTTTTAITVLVTPKNLLILNPLLIQHPSIVQTLVLPFPTPKDSPIPPGVENMKDLPPTYFAPMITTMSKLHDPILDWFQSHPSPPTSIISDFFLGWTQHLASQLGIPRFVFSPCGALSLSVTSLLWCQSQTSTTDGSIHDTMLVSFPEIPGCPTYPWWQLSRTYRAYVQGKKNGSSNGSDDLELMRNGFVANYLESFGIIFNSFHELEGIYLDHMKQTYFGGNRRLWAIGPLPKSGPAQRGSINCDIIPWLDTCEDHSVVYICFGTQVVLSNAQMEALAVGLEKSRVRFVWCVAKPTLGHVSGEYGMVPSWFGDRTADRGFIIRGWAPQVLILKHKAIGSYLTHCGWNSVLESICAGVPMLGWPMGADNFANATLLVNQMKIAVRVCEGEKTIPDVDELAQCMAESVATNSTSNNEMRMRVMALKQAATDTVSGGSSFKDFDDLVHHLFSD